MFIILRNAFQNIVVVCNINLLIHYSTPLTNIKTKNLFIYLFFGGISNYNAIENNEFE